jgi:hypothetical protein
MKVNLQKIWEKKMCWAWQKALDYANKFLEESTVQCSQEVHLKSLQAVIGRIVKLVQLVEGFEIQSSEAELREIAGELLSEKANAEKLAQPLLGSKQHGNSVHDDAEGQGGAQQGQSRVGKLLRRLGLLQDGLETSSIRSQLQPWGTTNQRYWTR